MKLFSLWFKRKKKSFDELKFSFETHQLDALTTFCYFIFDYYKLNFLNNDINYCDYLMLMLMVLRFEGAQTDFIQNMYTIWTCIDFATYLSFLIKIIKKLETWSMHLAESISLMIQLKEKINIIPDLKGTTIKYRIKWYFLQLIYYVLKTLCKINKVLLANGFN